MRVSLPLLLSLNGGYVDTASYLALQGLFTAHVTGNFVTFGAALVLGTSGALSKLLALPVFCLVVIFVRLFGGYLPVGGPPRIRVFLLLKLLLLAAGGGLAIALGPFKDSDSWQAISTGMVLVAAMAIQNAIHRIHLASAPPTTLMTGSSTQIMIDIADLLQGGLPEGATTAVRARLAKLSTTVLAFAGGCAAAALVYAFAGTSAFIVPPIVALLAIFVRLEEGPEEPHEAFATAAPGPTRPR
jgi:uncharacterized membrane protein YoaK (UPF0700 family)